jgi:hypothetical protein
VAYDPSIIAAIKRRAAQVEDPRKRNRYLRAALQIGIVESGLQNLDHGDADSKGWRQERQSLYKNPTNVKASVNRVFDEMAQHDQGQPSWELAADVQRPAEQYRGRYRDVASQAAKLAGGGVRASASTSTSTTTTPGQTTQTAISSGGDFTQPQLPQRQKPAVTGPAAPSYVKTPSVQFQMPDIAGRQASIKDAIARLGNVPQETTTATLTTPGQTTTTTSQTPSSSAPKTGKGGSKVLELIFNDGGQGYGIKDGQTVKGSDVFSAVWGGHADHVHAAAGPKTIVALGKAAQKMGLHVGENPHFGGVNPVHVPGSYHNKAEAIDVSGDKALMGKFARYVANYNRTRKL